MRALASAARESYLENGVWPGSPGAARDPATPGADGLVLPDRHALGGAYELVRHPSDDLGLPGRQRWLRDGLSIGACGIPDAGIRNAIAARLGRAAWTEPPGAPIPGTRLPVQTDCVRWELSPFGREAAHVDGNGDPLFAGVGIRGGVSRAPPPWRIRDPLNSDLGLRVGRLVPDPARPGERVFDERIALRADSRLDAAGSAVAVEARGLPARVTPPTPPSPGAVIAPPGPNVPPNVVVEVRGRGELRFDFANGSAGGVDIVAGTLYTPDLCYGRATPGPDC